MVGSIRARRRGILVGGLVAAGLARRRLKRRSARAQADRGRRLTELGKLHERGVITEDELIRGKRVLLEEG